MTSARKSVLLKPQNTQHWLSSTSSFLHPVPSPLCSALIGYPLHHRSCIQSLHHFAQHWLVILYILVSVSSTPITLLSTDFSLHHRSCIQYLHLLLAHWYQGLEGTGWRIHPMEAASYLLWWTLGLHLRGGTWPQPCCCCFPSAMLPSFRVCSKFKTRVWLNSVFTHIDVASVFI